MNIKRVAISGILFVVVALSALAWMKRQPHKAEYGSAQGERDVNGGILVGSISSNLPSDIKQELEKMESRRIAADKEILKAIERVSNQLQANSGTQLAPPPPAAPKPAPSPPPPPPPPPPSPAVVPVSADDVVLVVGILTAPRDASRLMHIALGSLAPKTAVVVQYRGELKAGEKEQLESKGIFVYPAGDYPQVNDNMKKTHGDSIERVKWRSKHVLDFASLLSTMLTRYPKAQYVAIYEDDLLLAEHTSERLVDGLQKGAASMGEWGIMSLYQGKDSLYEMSFASPFSQIPSFDKFPGFGTVALLFRPTVAKEVIAHCHERFAEHPIDMLLGEFYGRHRPPIYFATPNLVQHMGIRSSFPGNGAEREKLKSLTFVRYEDFKELREKPAHPYLGCFKDTVLDRDLSGMFDYSGSYGTPSKCAAFCSKYFFFGLQDGRECFCSNDYGRHGAAPDEQCKQPCSGATQCKSCGGPAVNAVYRTGLVLRADNTVSASEADSLRGSWATDYCA